MHKKLLIISANKTGLSTLKKGKKKPLEKFPRVFKPR